MTDVKRLIEVAFPLKQASLDSVHEKNVRHGHISTLHIWPARRPLAACRAALVAALLPDPEDERERERLLKRLGGEVTTEYRKRALPSGTVEEQPVEATVGGVLHWGRESSPDLGFFREEIRKAFGGRAPRVLDPFAGGGAIPLEAMRLGCEVTAADVNPVAWFILKCTLEYPQRLAGQHLPLPDFALQSPDFMEAYFKRTGKITRKQLERSLAAVQQQLFPATDADLAWHVRAWGHWVLERARRELARFYPTYAELEPLKPHRRPPGPPKLKLVPTKEDGTLDLAELNAEHDAGHLAVPQNPRWVVKPTVAYLWARTVRCKGCRATIPLLKTRWLCRKGNKRVLLTLTPNQGRTGVLFGIEEGVPVKGGNVAQRREHDKVLGLGTIARSGAWCPCCGRPGTVAMEMQDIRQEGLAGRLGAVMTAVVVDGQNGKEYRLPVGGESEQATRAADALPRVFGDVPFEMPCEGIVEDAKRNTWCVQYGASEFQSLFLPRQLVALGQFLLHTRMAIEGIRKSGYPGGWDEVLAGYLALAIDRLADRSSMQCRPDPSPTQSGVINTFARFALPFTWDFIESVTVSEASGGYLGNVEWIGKVVEHLTAAGAGAEVPPQTKVADAVGRSERGFDIVLTDPPYYDAIGYSVLMDFFYVWLRRTLHGLSPEIDAAFAEPLGPKWSDERGDGELIDDSSRFGGDAAASKRAYEEGMYRAFRACFEALNDDGRMVVVFANKSPDAWETLVAAMIRAGFVVTASWPIETERKSRTRSLGSAALASSVWLVCRKRPLTAKPGWDGPVLDAMKTRIAERLRDFWDAGIRGPDFVWAATGPALEAYSQHPVVKKTNAPGALLTVPEFLGHVRRLVVEYVVSRVLSHNGGGDVAGLDDVTTYYLLHRHDFGMGEAPAGACILYALSCGLSDRELEGPLELVIRKGKAADDDDDQDDGDEDEGEAEDTPEAGAKGAAFRLKPWDRRTRRSLGLEAPGDRPVPMIDQAHRLMQLWKAGDVIEVDRYVEARGLRASQLFHQVLQALVELADPGSAERATLESIANHLKGLGHRLDVGQRRLPDGGDDA